jgi:hypothetical protein
VKTILDNSRFLSCSLLLFVLLVLAANQNESPKPSSYAPAKDVAGQIEFYMKQIDDDLANQDEYGDEQQDRVMKVASTLIVLAQVLAHHDEEHALKKAAPALLRSAKNLADSAGQFATATAAQAELKQCLESASDESVEWTPVADLPQLMKQVPIVNNKLRSGVSGIRFKRLLDQNAGQAATLAAIAEASSHDKTYCSGEDEEALWAAICGNMRDAAAEVNAAVRKQDQEAAKAGLARLITTCDQCHEKFRD